MLKSLLVKLQKLKKLCGTQCCAGFCGYCRSSRYYALNKLEVSLKRHVSHRIKSSMCDMGNQNDSTLSDINTLAVPKSSTGERLRGMGSGFRRHCM